MRKISNKKKLSIAVVVLLLGGILVAYLFYMPHRDVVGLGAETTMKADSLVAEYLSDGIAANAKYLNEQGESTIIAVMGIVSSVTTDQNNQKVILLKADDANAGVSCTFTAATNKQVKDVKIGDDLTIKGVIRSGADYDEDLELYEDVILEKCTIIKK